MKKTAVFGLFALAIVGLVLSTSLVSAYRGDYSVEGPNYNDEKHAAMEEAFDTLDYDEWVELMTEDGRHPRVVDMVTESDFETFVEAHEAGMNGDSAKAQELRAQLGLNNGNGPHDETGYGKGQGKGQSNGMRQGLNQN